jgi:hypothetical protein
MADDDVKVNEDDADYATWTWKQIKLAICGGYGLDNNLVQEALNRTSDPMSLVNAGGKYLSASNTLEKFRGDAKKWTNDLVGPNGMWTGLGAKGFATMMGNVIGAADSLYQALAAQPTYFTSLDSAGKDLQTCIHDVEEADRWAAQTTIDRWNHQFRRYTLGVKPPWTERPDGTVIVAVSTYPEIVDKMTDMMRTAIRKLAEAYRWHIASMMIPEDVDVTPPNPVDSQPKLTMPKLTTPKIDTPNLKNLGTPGDLTTPNLNGLNRPQVPHLDSSLIAPDLTVPGAITGSLIDPNQLKLPAAPSLDPLTHLAGLGSPTLSPLADGLRLPGTSGPAGHLTDLQLNPLPSLAATDGPSLYPFGLSAVGAPGRTSASGRFANLSSGEGSGAGAAAALAAEEEAALAQRGMPGLGGMPGGGMPYLPPTGRGHGAEERERDTWLQEDEDIWGTNVDIAPAFIDGSHG